MEKKGIMESVSIPEGVNVSKEGDVLVIKGPKGELKKEIKNTSIEIKPEAGKLIIHSEKNTKKEKKMIFTYAALSRIWLKGAKEGFVYKLKICSSHFPMSASVKGDRFELKNFIGGVKPRHHVMPTGIKAKVEGDIITIEGVDRELVGNTSASLEKMTRRAAFDKRVFQDGIYIISKGDGEQ